MNFNDLNDIKARGDVLNLGNQPSIKVKYLKDGKFYVLAYDQPSSFVRSGKSSESQVKISLP